MQMTSALAMGKEEQEALRESYATKASESVMGAYPELNPAAWKGRSSVFGDEEDDTGAFSKGSDEVAPCTH